jgi:ubiquinol-cytochrome c reductase cytochrome b subunit
MFCRALEDRRRDEQLHGRETGRIVMTPQGGYTEIREPARPAAPLAAAPARAVTAPGPHDQS